MDDVTGKMLFVEPVTGQERSEAARTYSVVKDDLGLVFFTHPVAGGTLLGSGATVFEADDGRRWPARFVGCRDGKAWFLVEGDI